MTENGYLIILTGLKSLTMVGMNYNDLYSLEKRSKGATLAVQESERLDDAAHTLLFKLKLLIPIGGSLFFKTLTLLSI